MFLINIFIYNNCKQINSVFHGQKMQVVNKLIALFKATVDIKKALKKLDINCF